MLKSLLGLASPAGDGGRLSTLIFHRVLAEPDPLFPQEVDRPRFDLICGWIRYWFNVLPLDEAAARLKERTLPPRAMAITFDDGYEDNASVALPVLQRHGLPATFFVATGFLDGGRMWNDTVIEAIRRTAKATLDLRDVSAGSFGSYDVATAEAKRSAIGHILLKAKYLPPAERHAFGETLARVREPCVKARNRHLACHISAKSAADSVRNCVNAFLIVDEKTILVHLSSTDDAECVSFGLHNLPTPLGPVLAFSSIPIHSSSISMS